MINRICLYLLNSYEHKQMKNRIIKIIHKESENHVSFSKYHFSCLIIDQKQNKKQIHTFCLDEKKKPNPN